MGGWVFIVPVRVSENTRFWWDSTAYFAVARMSTGACLARLAKKSSLLILRSNDEVAAAGSGGNLQKLVRCRTEELCFLIKHISIPTLCEHKAKKKKKKTTFYILMGLYIKLCLFFLSKTFS